jgi:hypothetical protein
LGRVIRPIGKSHFHAFWLLWCGYEVDEVAELLSFSPRWVRALLKRYNECGAEALGDRRSRNGTKPTILTPDALAALNLTESHSLLAMAAVILPRCGNGIGWRRAAAGDVR